ncbi:VanZ family protein [Leucobacter chinensis]|uniref:VanZ family protein n=1 Tax=Leucobacter chinensis TaxID=2851010 RepID=UPI001C242E48|nr:VanZ family protein [Leucobacter chinensis]
MLATHLVEYPWVTPTVVLCFAIVSVFVGPWLLVRKGLTRVLLGIAFFAVVALVFTPTGREMSMVCEVEWMLPLPKYVEPFANLAMFVPLAYFAALASGRPIVTAIVASAGSALIETVQALVSALGRSCSTGDWLSNTLGAVLGAALGWAALAIARRRARARAQGESAIRH